MADIWNKQKRSEVMALIRSHGNKDTELALAKLFRIQQITGWRRKQNILGKPDFIFRKAKLAVFVDGCFWHGCPKHGTKPKSNRTYWLPKLERNRKRDLSVTRALRRKGWHVVRIWDCALQNRPQLCIERIRRLL